MQRFNTKQEKAEAQSLMSGIVGINLALTALFLLCGFAAGTASVKDKLVLVAAITGTTSITVGAALIATTPD